MCFLLHLQQTWEVVLVVKIAPHKQAHTNQQSRFNKHLQHADTLLRGCFCDETLHSISIFCKFYPSIQLTFSAYWFKKAFTSIKHSVTKFSVTLSVQYTLSFIISVFEEMFSQSRIFKRRIWYDGIIRSGKKWSGKCMVHRLMDTIPRTKQKTSPIWKIRVYYFYRAVYHIKKHVIPNMLLLPSWTSS